MSRLTFMSVNSGDILLDVLLVELDEKSVWCGLVLKVLLFATSHYVYIFLDKKFFLEKKIVDTEHKCKFVVPSNYANTVIYRSAKGSDHFSWPQHWSAAVFLSIWGCCRSRSGCCRSGMAELVRICRCCSQGRTVSWQDWRFDRKVFHLHLTAARYATWAASRFPLRDHSKDKQW